MNEKKLTTTETYQLISLAGRLRQLHDFGPFQAFSLMLRHVDLVAKMKRRASVSEDDIVLAIVEKEKHICTPLCGQAPITYRKM